VAVVGAGFIADFHLEILKATPGVELTVVCDADLPRAESSAVRFGVPRAVGSIEELGPDAVDVAHVLVPPPLHEPVVRRLLERGVGVFVEKPLALSSADARSLGALAAERGLPLGVNHNAVHHPAFARLLADVRAGRIGRVEHVQVTLRPRIYISGIFIVGTGRRRIWQTRFWWGRSGVTKARARSLMS
jgi:predicted dehydrogenase